MASMASRLFPWCSWKWTTSRAALTSAASRGRPAPHAALSSCSSRLYLLMRCTGFSRPQGTYVSEEAAAGPEGLVRAALQLAEEVMAVEVVEFLQVAEDAGPLAPEALRDVGPLQLRQVVLPDEAQGLHVLPLRGQQLLQDQARLPGAHERHQGLSLVLDVSLTLEGVTDPSLPPLGSLAVLLAVLPVLFLRVAPTVFVSHVQRREAGDARRAPAEAGALAQGAAEKSVRREADAPFPRRRAPQVGLAAAPGFWRTLHVFWEFFSFDALGLNLGGVGFIVTADARHGGGFCFALRRVDYLFLKGRRRGQGASARPRLPRLPPFLLLPHSYFPDPEDPEAPEAPQAPEAPEAPEAPGLQALSFRAWKCRAENRPPNLSSYMWSVLRL
ncbi:hypothetical protein EYF80_035881 [Liparis tanakae]|uniref:Uncharacterized protein n=1 Tax=Liparis tanakae TaxID=230148 RepID=A0A4Z2GM77_9TELE|nr:hypothetical protein EYF80_035881 [Liparis tanakae]